MFSFHLLEPPQSRLAATDGLEPYRPIGSNGDTGLDSPATNVIRIEMQLASQELQTFNEICEPEIILFAIVSN
jgi:hypothetical protein